MKDNKVRKSNHTENSVGIYSSAVNQAKINGINGVPQIEFEKLSEDEKNQWKALAAKNKEDIEAFYRNNANQIKFTLLHKIVILVLEETHSLVVVVDKVADTGKGAIDDRDLPSLMIVNLAATRYQRPAQRDVRGVFPYYRRLRLCAECQHQQRQ